MRALMSYAEVGKQFRISPERVRQIELRALRKLRAGLIKRGVTAGDVRRILTS